MNLNQLLKMKQEAFTRGNLQEIKRISKIIQLHKK